MTHGAADHADKSRFFCPDCGYEGGLDDDLVVDPAIDALRYYCPRCETLLDRRPHRGPSP